MQVRNYTYKDVITVSPAMSEYEKKIKIFFEEHIHDDEEIRYVLDGSGAPHCHEVLAETGFSHCFALDTESLQLSRLEYN